MKESVGYTVTLNIAITFIIIVFAFLSAAIIYFKSNKISNIIMNSIEKYEGYNELAITEINSKMESIGYTKSKITCSDTIANTCIRIKNDVDSQDSGYCVYECSDGEYYYYRVRTNMLINVPIINNILPIPIYSSTNKIFDFEEALK